MNYISMAAAMQSAIYGQLFKFPSIPPIEWHSSIEASIGRPLHSLNLNRVNQLNQMRLMSQRKMATEM